MSYWSKAPEDRGQLVLFPTRLDDAVAGDHAVRLLDEILGRIDWSEWEAKYHGRLGQPPLHPRVLCSVILYGLLTRIRSSRALEEALQVRLDFRWLVEGRGIDHTTLSGFRKQHQTEVKQLFVQVGLVARELGLLPLERLAYDGTRLRANNRRSGTRTPDELRQMRDELERKCVELETRVAVEDRRENELYGGETGNPLAAELSNVRVRQQRVDAALAELKRVEEAGETVPKRIPLTDPESRLTPNKDGGYAPNYTPLATVDAQTGLIAACDVIAMTDEEHFLLPQLRQVQENFSLPSLPAEVLGDGAMSTGANLKQLEELGVSLYSPASTLDPAQNPAIRADPSGPVPAEQWDALPTIQVPDGQGKKQPQLSKPAFVFDAERDCYWCPQGQALTPRQRTSEQVGPFRQVRTRYRVDLAVCAACPLKDRCLQPGQNERKNGREISRYDHEHLSEKLALRMATPEAQAKYARRKEVAERPFAVIKQQFGARRFLLRGLANVRTEWQWLATAFNLERLMSFVRGRAGPPGGLSRLAVDTG
jgi:transposase